MDELPVVLVSNACQDAFPDNTVSDFQNTVPRYNIFRAQQNPGNLEMALSECYVPKKYKNIASTVSKLMGKWEATKYTGALDAAFQIPSGHYASPKDLVDALNQSLTESYTKTTRPIQFSIAGSQGAKTKILFKILSYDVMLADDIARVLGFNPGELIIAPDVVGGTVFSPFTATTYAGSTQLMAYCSIVEKSVLADQMVNLLAILPWAPDNTGYDPSQHIVFQNLQWVDVVRHDFNSIAISIKDGSGRLVQMYGSNVTFMCKIRRKSQPVNLNLELMVSNLRLLIEHLQRKFH